MNNNLQSIIKMNFADDLLLDSETNSFFRVQSAEPENKDKTSLFATSQGLNTTQKVVLWFCVYFEVLSLVIRTPLFVLLRKYSTSAL